MVYWDLWGGLMEGLGGCEESEKGAMPLVVIKSFVQRHDIEELT